MTQGDTCRGDGLNLYAYCLNHPVYYEDPSGHWCDKKEKVFKDLMKERGLTDVDLANDPELKLRMMAEASNIVKNEKRADYIVTAEGVIISTNQDYNLVSTTTRTDKGGEYLQIHNLHTQHDLPNPHVHKPQLNIDPVSGRSSMVRKSGEAEAADINYMDQPLRNSTLRIRANRKEKEGINVSQFLIFKSKENLAKYGMNINDVVSNKNLYTQVVNKYIKNRDVQDIWIINRIDNMHIIEEISGRSELMIFWYGTDFHELDFISSKQELMKY